MDLYVFLWIFVFPATCFKHRMQFEKSEHTIFYLDLSLITKIINWSFEDGRFPDDLKIAELDPIFTKNDDVSQR